MIAGHRSRSHGERSRRELALREPVVADGRALWRIATGTPVLDANSAYAYVLWCRDFGSTSIVAETTDLGLDGTPRVVGFVTGYRRPATPEALFVWQVAVAERMRGRGVGTDLLTALVDRVRRHGVERVEATVAPGNAASQRLFRSVARRFAAPCTYPSPGGFGTDVLPDGHEPEPLLVIGPL